jgi:hypothetical protein
MRNVSFRDVVTKVFCLAVVVPASAQVRVTEIMYHPASENPAEEFIELRNAAATNLNLGGWHHPGRCSRFQVDRDSPVDFWWWRQYKRVCGRVSRGHELRRQLDRRAQQPDETLRLEDALGNAMEEVSYADEGDYATRVRGARLHASRLGLVVGCRRAGQVLERITF